MARELTFEGIPGSYDAAEFMALLEPVVAPYTPYVKTSGDGSRLSVSMPDESPVSLDIKVAQLAAQYSYDKLTKQASAARDKERKKSRRTEKMAAIRGKLDNIPASPAQRQSNAEDVLELFYDILKDME